MNDLACNIHDCALIFEGGGMRASYTSALAVRLIEEGVWFSHVYGVSAGASNTVNYLSRDAWRTRASFTTFAADPRFGGWKTWASHKGAFNAHFIYQEAGLPGGPLPFDLATFAANPAACTIASFERDTGATRLWTKDDMPTLDDVMVRVRASSTLPIVMPPAIIEGQAHYDGGFAEGAGLLVDAAMRDGFERFLIVRTRPKGYRKPVGTSPLMKAFFCRRPFMRAAVEARGAAYNAMCERIERLEDEGRAYVFFAEDMAVDTGTTDVAALEASYAAGERQTDRDWPAICAFLGIK